MADSSYSGQESFDILCIVIISVSIFISFKGHSFKTLLLY